MKAQRITKPRGAFRSAGTRIVHLPGHGAGVKMHHESNKTMLRTGMGRFTCPVCNLDFERPWAWAKRSNLQFCGRGCMAAARRIEIECECAICQKKFVRKPSAATGKRTCSAECDMAWRKVRQIHLRQPVGYEAYRRVRAEILKNSTCDACGTNIGPWVIRGVRGMPDASGFDLTFVSTLCKKCHITFLPGNRFMHKKAIEAAA